MSAGTKLATLEATNELVSSILDAACEYYESATGKKLDAKVYSFLQTCITDMIGLVMKGDVKPKDIAVIAVGRALKIADIAAGDQAMMECAVALGALALATYDAGAVVTGAAAVSTTGVGAVVGAGMVIAGTAFWSYQVFDTVQSCSAAVAPKVEKALGRHNIAGKRIETQIMVENSCRVPTERELIFHY